MCMDIGAAAYSRFLDGDDSGIEDIIAEYKDALILYLQGFCGNLTAAEDLMEDVFVKLVVDKPPFRGKSSFKTWLFAIAGNAARDYLRKSKRRSFVPLENVSSLSDEQDLLRGHIAKENDILVHKCMGRMNTDYRSVLYLTYFEGFTNAEAAKIMKKTTRQIENLLYRAKQSLKSEMLKEGFKYEE